VEEVGIMFWQSLLSIEKKFGQEVTESRYFELLEIRQVRRRYI
jgi:hypothetical protein